MQHLCVTFASVLALLTSITCYAHVSVKMQENRTKCSSENNQWNSEKICTLQNVCILTYTLLIIKYLCAVADVVSNYITVATPKGNEPRLYQGRQRRNRSTSLLLSLLSSRVNFAKWTRSSCSGLGLRRTSVHARCGDYRVLVTDDGIKLLVGTQWHATCYSTGILLPSTSL